MEYKPTLIVIAGPNGSGKTSITTQILKRSLAQASRLCLQKNHFTTKAPGTKQQSSKTIVFELCL